MDIFSPDKFKPPFTPVVHHMKITHAPVPKYQTYYSIFIQIYKCTSVNYNTIILTQILVPEKKNIQNIVRADFIDVQIRSFKDFARPS